MAFGFIRINLLYEFLYKRHIIKIFNGNNLYISTKGQDLYLGIDGRLLMTNYITHYKKYNH